MRCRLGGRGGGGWGWLDGQVAGTLGDVSRGVLDELLAAAPQPQRVGLRLLVALGRRPRGVRLLRRLGGADQLAQGVLGMARYEAPGLACALGWDADAVVARGRALRRAEGRP
jgi:hypothetical protein